MCAMFGWFNDARTLRFPLEAGEALGIAGKGLGQDFEGDFAVQLCIAGPIHLAHAAGPKGGEDLVRAEAGANEEGQKGCSDYQRSRVKGQRSRVKVVSDVR